MDARAEFEGIVVQMIGNESILHATLTERGLTML